MAISEEQAMDALEAAPDNTPKKKKIPLWGRVFGAFYQLSTSQRILYLAMLVIVVFWFGYILTRATEKPYVIEQEDILTQSEDQAGASIEIGTARNTGDTSQVFIDAKKQSEQQELAKAQDDKQSIIQGVTFADWETTEEEAVATPKEAYKQNTNDAIKKQVEDRHADGGNYYNTETGKAAFDTMMANLTTPNNNQTKSGKTSWPVKQSDVTGQGNNTGTLVDQSNADFNASYTPVSAQDVATLKRGLLPGDNIPCFLEKGLDSTISSQVNCNILTGALKGGRFVLAVTQKNDYLILAANTLVYKNNYGQTSAIAGPASDVAMSGVRDSVDYHTLYRWSALMLGGAGEAIWEIVSQPNQTVVTTGTSTTVSSGEYDDKDIILGALSRPVAIASQNAINEFNMPPTVKADKHRLIYVVMTSAFDAQWLPNVKL